MQLLFHPAGGRSQERSGHRQEPIQASGPWVGSNNRYYVCTTDTSFVTFSPWLAHTATRTVGPRLESGASGDYLLLIAPRLWMQRMEDANPELRYELLHYGEGTHCARLDGNFCYCPRCS